VPPPTPAPSSPAPLAAIRPPTANADSSQPLLPYLAMLAGAIAFTIMGACAHALGQRCAWQLAMVARSAIPLILTLGLATRAGAQLVWRGPANLWLRSIAGSLSMMGAFYAFSGLPISQVLTMTNLYPIWVAVLSWPLLGQLPAADVWIAAATGIAGVWLIEQPDSPEASRATWAALTSSLMSGFAMIGLHRLKQLDPRAVVAHFSGVSLLFALGAWLLLENRPVPNPQPLLAPTTLALMAGVGLSATVGQLLLTIAFTYGQPARVAVVGLVQVALGMLCDVLLWQQPLGPQTLLGTVLVVGPTAWVMLKR